MRIFILLSILPTFACIMHSQNMRQEEYFLHNSTKESYLIKYVEIPKRDNFHPSMPNYFLYFPHQIETPLIDSCLLSNSIPYYLTKQKGFIWGHSGHIFTSHILGCCEFGNVKMGVKYMFDNEKNDTLIKYYDSLSISPTIFEDNFTRFTLSKKNVSIMVDICKVEANYCFCPLFEDLNYRTSGKDTMVFIKELMRIEKLNKKEAAYFQNLFSIIVENQRP